MVRVRSLLPPALLAALLAVGLFAFLPTHRAAAEASPSTTIFTFSLVGQELFSCTGDYFLVTDGQIQVVTSLTLLADNNIRVHSEVTWQGVKAINEATGAVYEDVGANGDGVNGSFDNFFSNQGATTETVSTHVQLVGQGTAPNIGFDEVIHLTYDGTGQLRVAFDHLNMDC